MVVKTRVNRAEQTTKNNTQQTELHKITNMPIISDFIKESFRQTSESLAETAQMKYQKLKLNSPNTQLHTTANRYKR